MASPPPSYSSVVLQDQPLVYYRLDESTGTVAADSSGNAQNGTYPSGVTLGTSGAIAGDSDTAVSGGTVLNQGGGTLPAGNAARTFEFWVKAGGTPNSNLVGNDDFSFWIGGANLNVQQPAGAGSVGIGMPQPLTDNKWHLLDFSYDGTVMTLYEDGQSWRTLTFGGQYATVPSRGFWLGGLAASYDEAAVYGTALSPARVEAHWTRGGNGSTSCASVPSDALAQSVLASHPVAFFPLQDLNVDATDRVAFDVSGNCFNGAYNDGASPNPTNQPAGASGGSLGMAKGAGTVSQSGTQLPTGNTPRSLGVWLNATSTPNSNTFFEGDFGFWIGGANINPVLPGGGSVGIGMPYPLGDGRWHQVYQTYDGSTIHLYEDGMEYYRLGVSGQYGTSTVGAVHIGDLPGAYLDAAVYPTALGATAINSQWTKGISRLGPCVAATTAYGQAVVADSPTAFFPLKDLETDSTSRVAFDGSGNCMNGEYGTSVTPDAANTPPGDSGGSVVLNGGVIRAPGALLPAGNAARTFEVWIKSTSAPNNNVLYQGDFGFWIGGANLNMTFPGGGSWGWGMPAPLTDGRWHLIDYAYDGTSLLLYEDGSQFGTAAAGGSYGTSPSSPFVMGAFPGDWADVAVYAGALSADRIRDHWSTGAATGPIGGAYNADQNAGGQNLCIACAFRSILNGIFGDPVNTATGNLTENIADVSLGGRGLPLQFTRTYNSQYAAVNNQLGYGWTFNAGASLRQDSLSGAVTIVQENGSQVTFTKSGTTYTPSAPRFIATLVQNADGTFTFTRSGQQTFVFSSSGQVLTDHAAGEQRRLPVQRRRRQPHRRVRRQRWALGLQLRHRTSPDPHPGPQGQHHHQRLRRGHRQSHLAEAGPAQSAVDVHLRG